MTPEMITACGGVGGGLLVLAFACLQLVKPIKHESPCKPLLDVSEELHTLIGEVRAMLAMMEKGKR